MLRIGRLNSLSPEAELRQHGVEGLVTPNMHKVHHSHAARETDTNYGNILSLHDRVLGTFTPTARALSVVYGLDGVDAVEAQSFAGMLALPFQRGPGGEGRVEILRSSLDRGTVCD